MTFKWENFSFRQTQTGSNTWPGGAITDPNDATQETNACYVSPTYNYQYPTTGLNGFNFGLIRNVGPVSGNITATNAGNDPLLGGNIFLNSGDQDIQFDIQPGNYDFRCALGSGSGTGIVSGVFIDGTQANIINLLPYGSSFTIWTANTSYNTIRMIVDPNDIATRTYPYKLWGCTVSGTSGASWNPPPTAYGSTYTDGSIVWTRLPVDAFLAINNTVTANSNVIDQNNNNVAASSWSSQPTLTVNLGNSGRGPSFTLFHFVTGTYLRQVSYRLQTPVLTDVTLNDEYGQPTTNPTIYANQPSDMPTLQINASSGAYTTSSFTLGGDLGPYFKVTKFGASIYATTNGTRLPDSLAGSRTLTITQTDYTASPYGYVTTFTCNVVSSQNRPTDQTLLGSISTEMWLKRKKMLDVYAASWQGYTGQPITQTWDVTTTAELQSALDALRSLNIPAGNTNWYRIRFKNNPSINSTYTGSASTGSSLQGLNFYDGGLLWEPYPGDDPDINIAFYPMLIRGLHVRNLCFPGDMTAYFLFRFIYPASSIANASSSTNWLNNRIVFDNCRFGLLNATHTTYDKNTINPTTQLIAVEQSETFVVKNCSFKGFFLSILGTGRMCYWNNNEFQWWISDIHRPGQPPYYATPRNADFAYANGDPNIYVWVGNNTCRNQVDITGYNSLNHVDFCQISREYNGVKNWQADSGPSGSISTPYLVDNTTYVLDYGLPYVYYSVVSILGTGQLGTNDYTTRSSPVQVGTESTYTKISAGSSHTTAVRSNNLYTWGSSLYGQLGQSDTNSRSSPAQIGSDTYITSATRGSHTVAIKSDGALYTWGLNSSGQLGDNTRTNRTVPTAMIGGGSWIAVSAGYSHSMAIRSDGTLWAWGNNSYGQLGDNKLATYRSSPVQIGTSIWNSVSAGDIHTLAVKSDNTLWSWGYNGYGQLGQNDLVDRSSPVQVGASYSSSSASQATSFAIKTDGTLWAWGNNSWGHSGLTAPYVGVYNSSTVVTDNEVQWKLLYPNPSGPQVIGNPPTPGVPSPKISPMYLHQENNCINAASTLANPPAIQFMLNSDEDHAVPLYYSALNNLSGTGSSYGSGVVDAQISLFEYNTYAGPTSLYPNGATENPPTSLWAGSNMTGKVKERYNLYAGVYPTSLVTVGTGLLPNPNMTTNPAISTGVVSSYSTSQQSIWVSTSSPVQVGSTAPNVQTRGGNNWTLVTTTGASKYNYTWMNYSVNIDGTQPLIDFRSDMSKNYHFDNSSNIANVAGARLLENYSYTVSVSDFAGRSVPVAISQNIKPIDTLVLPNPFILNAVTGAVVSTVTSSNTVTLSGFTDTAMVMVDSGLEWRKNNGSWVTSGTVVSGDTLQVRLIASSNFATTITKNVSVGDYMTSFAVTTRNQPPASVVSKNLIDVYNLQYTGAGLSDPSLLALPQVGTNIPSGSTINNTSKQIRLTNSGGPYVINNVDFSGYDVYVDGPVQYTFNNCKFTTGPYFALAFARNNTVDTPTVYINDCWFNLLNAPRVFEAPVYGKVNLIARRCLFTDSPADPLSSAAQIANWDFQYCAFLRMGRSPGAAHLETGHIYGGSSIMRKCLVLVDPSVPSGTWKAGGGWTGFLFPEPTVGNITWEISESVLVGANIQGNGGYTVIKPFFGIQTSAKLGNTNNGTFSNNVMDRGTSGYLIASSGATIVGSGNIDYDTNTPFGV